LADEPLSEVPAREVLSELTLALLEAFARSGDPDAALSAFDEALARMPASVQLLSILRSNSALRELFGDVLGSATRLAQVIASRLHVLDAAIDPSRSLDFDTSFDDEALGRGSRRSWPKSRVSRTP
jgi:glutamate-ammonia-ligase adenylyltransferase